MINDAGEESYNGGKSFSGYTVMDNNDKYNTVLSGSGKSFTFEVMVKPASKSQNSVFLSKGDTQVALKTKSSGSGLEFFVYNNNSWKSASCDFLTIGRIIGIKWLEYMIEVRLKFM